MSDLRELIQKLESATEWSRKLDAMIAVAVGDSPHDNIDTACACGCSRYYTERLDVALPWERDGYWEISGPRQYLNIPSPIPNYWCAQFTYGPQFQAKTYTAWGATEALARRAAALRAREAQP